jgi:HAE1 family hydrophobic/amphiphilic exporter-1
MLVGLLALSKLKVNQFPEVEPPVLVINIPYPGASPETVEREVVNRIEKALQSISGVDRSNSTSREGSATLVLVFDFSKNMIEAADEVRNAIASVRYKLPTEIREPIITRADPGAQPILQLSLSSTTLTHAQLSRLAEDQLAERFRGITGVAVVNVNGALRRELSILLRAEKASPSPKSPMPCARRTRRRRSARCAASWRTRASACSAGWKARPSSSR